MKSRRSIKANVSVAGDFPETIEIRVYNQTKYLKIPIEDNHYELTNTKTMKLTIQNSPIKAASLLLMAMFLVFILPEQSAFAQTESEKVYKEVDEMPSPSGGIDGWNDYLAKNMTYPKAARKANVEGMVMVSFVVQETGDVSAVEIVRGIGGGCDEEVLRLVKESPKWNPGKKDGKIVKTQMMLPVNFKL